MYSGTYRIVCIISCIVSYRGLSVSFQPYNLLKPTEPIFWCKSSTLLLLAKVISLQCKQNCDKVYMKVERLCSEDPSTAPWLPILLIHIGSQVKTRQSQRYKFKEFAKTSKFLLLKSFYKWHTFWSFLIRCENVKRIRQVLLKIQNGHDSVHRRRDRPTDGQYETSIPLSTSLKQWV